MDRVKKPTTKKKQAPAARDRLVGIASKAEEKPEEALSSFGKMGVALPKGEARDQWVDYLDKVEKRYEEQKDSADWADAASMVAKALATLGSAWGSTAKARDWRAPSFVNDGSITSNQRAESRDQYSRNRALGERQLKSLDTPVKSDFGKINNGVMDSTSPDTPIREIGSKFYNASTGQEIKASNLKNRTKKAAAAGAKSVKRQKVKDPNTGVEYFVDPSNPEDRLRANPESGIAEGEEDTRLEREADQILSNNPEFRKRAEKINDKYNGKTGPLTGLENRLRQVSNIEKLIRDNNPASLGLLSSMVAKGIKGEVGNLSKFDQQGTTSLQSIEGQLKSMLSKYKDGKLDMDYRKNMLNVLWSMKAEVGDSMGRVQERMIRDVSVTTGRKLSSAQARAYLQPRDPKEASATPEWWTDNNTVEIEKRLREGDAEIEKLNNASNTEKKSGKTEDGRKSLINEAASAMQEWWDK